MNLNTVAKKVSDCEGGKKQVNIAQIKEVIRCTFFVLNQYEPWDVLKTIEETK